MASLPLILCQDGRLTAAVYGRQHGTQDRTNGISMRERFSTASNMEGFETNNITDQNGPNGHLEDQNLPSAKFTGVVSQKNGTWAAQIYMKRQRYWLGVFRTEKAAAMAYDSAAIKLRGRRSRRNLPWTELTTQELSFQNLYSTEAVLNMIKYKAYDSVFAEYLADHSSNITNNGLQQANSEWNILNHKTIMHQELFRKELTGSDVGDLRRFLIPKKHATKIFSQPTDGVFDPEQSHMNSGVYLEFFDRKMNSWKFRYCYWKTSKSFVFTKGWSKFVKEKNLKERETIVFYKCWWKESSSLVQTFFVIDIGGNRENARNETEREDGTVQREVNLEHRSEGSDGKRRNVNEENGEGAAKVSKQVKLFGVVMN